MINISIIKNISAAIICVAMMLPLSSCVKDNFTVPGPGANMDPAGVQATMTIKDFKVKYYVPILNSTVPVLLADSNVVIEGIVNADDRSGNFYKTISLQDATGGLQVKINGSGLYYDYPVGRHIFIKTQGLYIFNYGGTLELGGYIDLSGNFPSVGGIATTNVNNSIIKGKWGLPVPVKKVSISDLNNADYINAQSMLYEIDNVEFNALDTSGVYANDLSKASLNVPLEDCSGYSLSVRTSGYAGFAGQKPAKGFGNILGIYSYYSYSSSGNVQFAIRDTTDVMFTSAQRCH